MKKEIIAIVAFLAASQGIGKAGKLPWEDTPIPTDMKRFTKETTGHTVIMGKKTYWSIPEKFRPLPNRITIVVTKDDPALYPKDVIVVTSLEAAIAAAQTEKVFLIGGEGIYKEALAKGIPHTLLVTKVYGLNIICDAFFPSINLIDWVIKSEGPQILDERSGLTVSFVEYKNRYRLALSE